MAKKPPTQPTYVYRHIYTYMCIYIYLKSQALGSSEILKTQYIPCRRSCDIFVIVQLNKGTTPVSRVVHCYLVDIWPSKSLCSLGIFCGHMYLYIYIYIFCVHTCKVHINADTVKEKSSNLSRKIKIFFFKVCLFVCFPFILPLAAISVVQ